MEIRGSTHRNISKERDNENEMKKAIKSQMSKLYKSMAQTIDI
jgi:hypothetical protein